MCPDTFWYQEWGIDWSLVPEKYSVTLEEVLQVVAEQGKAIIELTNAVENLPVHKTQTILAPIRPKIQSRVTDDGQSICFKCNGVGHIAKTVSRDINLSASEIPKASTVQENSNPQLWARQCEDKL